MILLIDRTYCSEAPLQRHKRTSLLLSDLLSYSKVLDRMFYQTIMQRVQKYPHSYLLVSEILHLFPQPKWNQGTSFLNQNQEMSFDCQTLSADGDPPWLMQKCSRTSKYTGRNYIFLWVKWGMYFSSNALKMPFKSWTDVNRNNKLT